MCILDRQIDAMCQSSRANEDKLFHAYRYDNLSTAQMDSAVNTSPVCTGDASDTFAILPYPTTGYLTAAFPCAIKQRLHYRARRSILCPVGKYVFTIRPIVHLSQGLGATLHIFGNLVALVILNPYEMNGLFTSRISRVVTLDRSNGLLRHCV